MNWLKVLTAKQISGLVFTRYIKDPSCLYIVGFTKSQYKAAIFFRFASMGVTVDL